MRQWERKAEKLRSLVSALGSAAVAFSGGADSTLVAKIARDELGARVIAVTIESPLYPRSELDAAKNVARRIGIRHLVVRTDPLTSKAFSSNPADRCYLCKLEDLKQVRKIADERGLKEVVDGSNADDRTDYRPGMKAKEKLGVRSPLAEVGIRKEDVREISKALRLPTASKRASPCLASRIPYGEIITKEKLRMIEQAEDYLRSKGFDDVRVRAHGTVARIEVSPDQISKLASGTTRSAIARKLHSIGFSYVSLDLEGYRMGSMNEVLGI